MVNNIINKLSPLCDQTTNSLTQGYNISSIRKSRIWIWPCRSAERKYGKKNNMIIHKTSDDMDFGTCHRHLKFLNNFALSFDDSLRRWDSGKCKWEDIVPSGDQGSRGSRPWNGERCSKLQINLLLSRLFGLTLCCLGEINMVFSPNIWAKTEKWPSKW